MSESCETPALPVRQAMEDELNTIVRIVTSIPSSRDATSISMSVKPERSFSRFMGLTSSDRLGNGFR